MIKTVLKGFTDLLFPRNCLLCHHYDRGTDQNPLCRSCQDKIPYNHPPFCLKCSRHLKTAVPEGLCPDCRKHPPDFDSAWGCTLYEGPMKDLIHAFKFQNKTSLRKTFRHIARTFLTRYRVSLEGFDHLLPIPLTSTRQRERGYNQALLFAKELSQILNIPCVADQLLRPGHGARQSDLREKERWTNIQGAFRINPLSTATGKNILLVDDLLTTGATASEAARTLRSAGAGKIGLIVLSLA